MPFLMIRNDIVKVKADAIVNPANEYLLEGSGTSRAIYLAEGYHLESIAFPLLSAGYYGYPQELLPPIGAAGEAVQKNRSLEKLIDQQKNRYGWEFLFLGANMDAVSEAEKFGLPPGGSTQELRREQRPL